MRNKKRNKLFLLILLILGITLGYAFLSTTLNITGTAGIKSGTWDIHWKSGSVAVSSGSVAGDTPLISGEKNDTVTFSATLELPGDYFEFTVDAENSGTVDGMLDEIVTTITDGDSTSETYGQEVELEDYINYTVTYADGSPLVKYQKLGAGKTEKIKVRIEFDRNAEEVPEEDLTYNIETEVPYVQPQEDKIMPVRYAEFDTGSNVATKIRGLAGDDISGSEAWRNNNTNITSIVKSTTAPDTSLMTDDNIISSSNSDAIIYAWFDNGTIYYYTEAEDVFLNEDASHMFNNLKNINSIDTSYNTKNTKDMAGMFENTTINTLDLSNFSTGNVTNMAGMFENTTINTLDLSNFSTGNVTNMSGMFAGSQIPTLDVSSFNTSKVTNMGGMFAGCNTASLDLSNFDVSHVTEFGMFGGCSAKTIDISNWNFASVTSLSSFFSGCSNVENIILKNVNTSNITNMGYMFSGLSKLKSLDLSSFDVSHVTAFNLFGGDSSLKSIDISGWNFASTTTLNNFFSAGLSSLETVNLEGVNTSNITNMYAMFAACGKIKELDLSSFDTRNVTNMNSMLASMSSLTTVIVSDNFVVDQVTNSGGMFGGSTKLVGGNGTTYDVDNVDKVYAHYDYGESNPGYFNKANATMYTVTFDANGGSVSPSVKRVYAGNRIGSLPVATRKGYAFEGWHIGSINGIKIDQTYIPSSNIKVVAGWGKIEAEFDTGKNVNGKLKALAGDDVAVANPYGVRDTAIKEFKRAANAPDTSNMTEANIISSSNSSVPIYAWFDTDTIYYWSSAREEYLNSDSSNMFFGFNGLTNIELDFNTSNVTNMQDMFYECSSLPSIDVSNFNTSSVTNMVRMFAYCYELTSLDLSNFNTSKAVMDDITIGCRKMTDIDISNWDLSNYQTLYYTSTRGIFWIILGNSSLPPFKKITADNVIFNSDGYRAFYSFSNLEELSLNNVDTSRVTTMDEMFWMDYKLKSLDLSDFDTSNVTNMHWMFYECNNLTSVDVSSFNTSKVTDMTGMFYECDSLIKLDLSNFDTRNVVSFTGLADGVNLEELNISNFRFDSFNHNYSIMGAIKYSNSSKLKKLIADNIVLPADSHYAFGGLTGLEEISLKNVDTTNVTNMNNMFGSDEKLTTIDLSSFDTRNVTDMGYMFWGNTLLETIYVSNNFVVDGVTNHSDMFSGCTSLVGGNGTVYDSNHTDKEYARIDTANTLGYFTLKNNLNNLGNSIVNTANIFKKA